MKAQTLKKLLFLSLLLFIIAQKTFSQCNSINFTINAVSVCLPNAVVSFDPTNIPPNATFLWDFGDGNSSTQIKPNHVYTSAGNFSVSLTVYIPTDTCTITKTNLITVFPAIQKPQIIPTDTLICNGEDQPFSVDFCNYSPNIAKWKWVIESVVDSSSGNCITHSFTDSRCYEIALEVTDFNGCKNANVEQDLLCIYKTIGISIKPESPICNEMEGDYKSILTLNGNTIKNQTWMFQGGTPSSSNLANPDVVSYGSSDCYDVSLIIEAESGCKYGDTETVLLPPPLTFTISPNPACIKEDITLTNTTSFPACNTGNTIWSWQGGAPILFQNPLNLNKNPGKIKVFNTTGNYNIFLDYTNGFCYYRSLPVQLEVVSPVANFDFDPENIGCHIPYEVTFTNLSTIPDNNATYLWVVYDTNKTTVLQTYTSKDIMHTFTGFGNFNVQLIVSHPNGCTDSIIQEIQIANPIADFSFSDTIHCLPGPPVTPFTITNLTQPTNIVFDYDWVFESQKDTFILKKTVIPSLPPTPGIYNVTLIAYTDTSSGCSDTMTKQNYLVMNGIYGTISIDTNKSCKPFTNNLEAEVTLNALYSDASDSTLTYSWSFPPFPAPPITYSNADSSKTTGTYNFDKSCYNPILTITNSLGCVTQLSQNVIIGTSARFGTALGLLCDPCCGLSAGSLCTGVAHDLFTCHCDPGIVSYQWSTNSPTAILSNDSLSTNKIIFDDTLPVSIQLIVINDIGCTDTSTLTAITPIGIFANFIADDTIKNCNGNLIVFTDLSYGKDLKWRWDFGDSLSTENNSTESSPAHVYNINHEGYTVTLIVTDSFGCSDTLQKPQYIKITGPIFNSISTYNNSCDSTILEIFDSSTFYTNILIDYGDGTTNDSIISNYYTHVYGYDSSGNNPNQYFPVIIISDSTCALVDSIENIIVYISPTINIGNDTTFCEPFFLTLNAGNFASYNWSTGDTSKQITPEITATYWVEVTDTNNCIGTDSIDLTINQRPDISTSGETTIITGQCTDIWARADIFSNYHWSPNSFINDTTITTPTVCPKDTTNYKIILTSSNGCVDSSSVLVIVLEEGFVKTPNTFTPNGDGLNDEFNLINQGIKELFYLKIYNRWGQLVFETNDINAAWDGTKNGKPQEVGIYIIEYEGITLDNINQFKRGQLALVR